VVENNHLEINVSTAINDNWLRLDQSAFSIQFHNCCMHYKPAGKKSINSKAFHSDDSILLFELPGSNYSNFPDPFPDFGMLMIKFKSINVFTLTH
jgi:hypothetical protein